MQQLVIKDGLVLATHTPEQDIRGAYFDCEIILYRGSYVSQGDLDPRTDEEKQNNYADKRRMAYPTIVDQLDMMYHDQVDGTTIWMETIQEIKGQYPKQARETLKVDKD